MLFPTFYTLGGLTLVVLTRELIGYSEMVINRGLSLADVGALALYQMLPVMGQMLPFAVLVGGLIALGRLGADREILILEASGVSSPRMLGPVMVFAAMTSVLALFLALEASPWASRSLDEKLEEIGRRNPGAAVTPGSVHRFGNWMLQAREVSANGEQMRGVFLWMPSVGETVFAESGRLVTGAAGGTEVQLVNGSLMLNPRKTARELRFGRLKAELPATDEPVGRSDMDQLGSASVAQLVEASRDDSAGRSLRLQIGLQLHQRFALPAATLVFGLLMVPLFLARAQFSRSGGGVLGLLVAIAYYGLTQFGDSLVYRGDLSPLLGAWLANGVLSLVAVVMAFRMTRVSAFGRHTDRSRSRAAAGTSDREPGEARRIRVSRFALERYVGARFLQVTALCFAVSLAGYLVVDILDRLQWMGKYGATLSQVMSYYAARVPLLASRVVPMSLLVSTALTVSLLAGQGELMGMRASGIPATRALMPILVICALISPAYFLLNNEVLPKTNALVSYFKDVVKRKDVRDQGLGAWFLDGDTFYQAERLDPKAGTGGNITVFALGKEGLPESRSDARSARHIGGGQWLLEDSVRVERTPEGLARAEGPTHAEIGEAIDAGVNTRHLSVGQLQEEIGRVEARGLDATHYRVDLFVKLASPIACLVLPALALFFAVGGPPHPSSATTLVFSAVVAVAYVLLTGVGTSLGYGGVVPTWLGGMAPNLIFLALAAYFGFRLRGSGQSLGRV
jgi:lipopolysaccharide export system permease protein